VESSSRREYVKKKTMRHTRRER
jgi:hypothetical protein